MPSDLAGLPAVLGVTTRQGRAAGLGPLKADLAAHRLGMPVLGVAGVATWKSALPYIDRLQPAEVIVAFDQDEDPATRAAVEQNAQALAQALEGRGIRVRRATWEGAKGLDEALVAGVSIRLA